MSEMNYKPNSNRSRENPQGENQIAEKKVDAVVTGKVQTKKKGLMTKVAELFTPDDISEFKDYVINDLLIGNGRQFLLDTGCKILEELFGGSQPNKSSVTKISYGSYYKGNNQQDRRRAVRPANPRVEYEDLVFESRSDAERVLNGMDDILDNYPTVSIADLFELASISTNNYNLRSYGWRDISDAKVIRIREGFLLQMPKAIPLD